MIAEDGSSLVFYILKKKTIPQWQRLEQLKSLAKAYLDHKPCKQRMKKANITDRAPGERKGFAKKESNVCGFDKIAKTHTQENIDLWAVIW